LPDQMAGNTRELKSAPSSRSRSPTPCRFKHSHLARVSASWLACTLTLGRWVPKWTLFFTLFLGSLPAQPLRLALVDPIDRYLRAWKPVLSWLQFNQQRVLSRFFSLFQRPPLPPWRNEKLRLRSWKLELNQTAIREGRTERNTALEITSSIIRGPRGIKIRC
jgi:hypothetical protein